MNDRMTLLCETRDGGGDTLARAITDSVRELTKLRGEVAFCDPGTLPNVGKVIDDIRKYE